MKHKFKINRIKNIIKEELLKEALEYTTDPSITGFIGNGSIEKDLSELIEDYFEDNGILIDESSHEVIQLCIKKINEVVENTSTRI